MRISEALQILVDNGFGVTKVRDIYPDGSRVVMYTIVVPDKYIDGVCLRAFKKLVENCSCMNISMDGFLANAWDIWFEELYLRDQL